MKYILISLLVTSIVGNLYFLTRSKTICEIQKEEILSKIGQLDSESLNEQYAGKLLLLLLAELGLKDKIQLDSNIFETHKCSDKVIEKVVEKIVPKEVIKTVIKKERFESPFVKKNAMPFISLMDNKIDPELIYTESYLSIFEANRLNIIESGTYIIEHEEANAAFETLTIENKLKYQDKIWQGQFSSVITRNEKKVLSEFKTTGANSKIFVSTNVRNSVTWKQKDFMVILWLSKKERLRFNGIIYKKDNEGQYKKYGNLMLQNY